jgi:hypothetical protein
MNFENILPSTYRITAVLKVETDIFIGVKASLIGRSAIIMIMYVKTFKTADIVFIGNILMCLISDNNTDR